MYFVWIPNRRTTFALHSINRSVFITQVESVYCAVRIESLYRADTFRFERVKHAIRQ